MVDNKQFLKQNFSAD